MIRICTRIIRYNISVPRLDLTPKGMRNSHQIDFFPIVGYHQKKLGACVLNQPANQNMLTQEFVDQFYRYMVSYQHDNSVENIWIESKNGVFSHGVDYKKLSEDPNYLDKLGKLAILIAKVNKPTFGQISGGVRGAGAYILSMMSMPMGRGQVNMKIDEVSRGMIPLMGGTHRLSRLPLHIGYYLALTGDELNGQEMAQLKFLKGGIRQGVSNKEIRDKLQEANLYFREKFRYTDFDDSQTLLEYEERIKIIQNKEKFSKKLKYRQTELLVHPPRNLNIKFAVNQHLVASSDYFNATNPFNSFSDNQGRTINNYYEMRQDRPLNYLQQHKLVDVYEMTGVQIPRLDLAKIDFIFGKKSIGEIVRALEPMTEEWAKNALEKIKSADPLALHLTFKLLKKAENASWISCVQNEYAVARRLTQNSSLKLKTAKNTSQFILINQYSDKGLISITPQIINSYFVPIEGEYKFEHEVPDKSLYPTVDYYRLIPDSVRTYLNRQKFVDKHITEQYNEVKRFLNRTKINYGSKVYDVNVLRQKIFQKLQLQKEKELIVRRLSYLATDVNYLKKYQKQCSSYLRSVNDDKLQNFVVSQIKNVFKRKLENRFKDFEQKTANMAGLENKLALFKKIKDIIVDNIIYNGPQYELKQKNTEKYNGPIYFDTKGKDIYSSTNTYLQQNQALNQLSQDLAKGTEPSEEFKAKADEVMPKYFGIPTYLMPFEQTEHDMWERIKFFYDEKPQVWAEAHTVKQLIIQASRTSEELGGYLQWNYKNFYDLMIYSDKLKQTYGEFADDMITEVKSMRNSKLAKLSNVEATRKEILQSGIFNKFYQFRQNEQIRSIFPYYMDQNTIPALFRNSFMSMLDSTLSEFTSMYKDRQLQIPQQLPVLDHWINKDIASGYTDFLKNDVQYVTSYLQVLFVKDMLLHLKNLVEEKGAENVTVRQICNVMHTRYQINFSNLKPEVTIKDIDEAIVSYLYFLMDMHSQAKNKINSPQSKLIDFLNRLKTAYEGSIDSPLPYSFESLILLIAKDRKKIYDRFLGEKFMAEPEFLLTFLNQESKLTSKDLSSVKYNAVDTLNDRTFGNYFNQHYDFKCKTRELVQNYLYYMILFENYIHQVSGKESFIPTNFVNEQGKTFNAYCHKIMNSDTYEKWVREEVRAVIEQLLGERETIERKLTKGQLYLYDQQFMQKLKPESIKTLIESKLQEEIYLVINMFSDPREYEFEPTEEQVYDQNYTRTKRIIKNPDALKKLNNLTMAEQIYIKYMEDTSNKDDLKEQERRFVQNERQYFKNGYVTRLPMKSYNRMARDVFVHPQDMTKVPQTLRETELFKKTNIKFSQALAGEKITLSNFTSEYKQLSQKSKDSIIQEMVSKIKMVESL